jgi:hypothetical protein
LFQHPFFSYLYSTQAETRFSKAKAAATRPRSKKKKRGKNVHTIRTKKKKKKTKAVEINHQAKKRNAAGGNHTTDYVRSHVEAIVCA